MRTILEGAHIVPVDAAGSEYPAGHLVIEGDRIVAVGNGPASAVHREGAEVIDATGCLVTPGLVNTHHHLYQWLTRGLVQDAALFDWLVALYPVWARIDLPGVRAAAGAGLATLAVSGCTLAADHHYVFPRGSGDLLGAVVDAAGEVGLRLTAARGSMDLGASQGGLPPDSSVETLDRILTASADAVARFHDPAPDAMVQVALAPCSPFSVSTDLLRESAALARELGVRLHTHGAETREEAAWCRDRFGLDPAAYLESVGWLGDDVWLAHCVHLEPDDVGRLAATGTGVAHCPSSNARLGAGVAPVPELLAAGVPVGLGVDGAASNECGGLAAEVRQALLVQRIRSGASALDGRAVLRAATMGGARVLGRDRELGSLEVGKLADVAVWRIDGVAHAGLADPVAALTLAAPPPVALLLVGGRPVVRDGRLVTADEDRLARDAARASARLRDRAS